MGRGNYLPHVEDWLDYYMFYVDWSNWYNEDDPEDFEFRCEDFRDDLRNLLDGTKLDFLYDKYKWLKDDLRLFAENGHYQIALADNQSSQAVCIGVVHNLGFENAERVLRKLVEGLKDWGYVVMYRTGAWTSRVA